MAKKRLRSTVTDNHGNEYTVYLEDGRNGAVVNIDSTPGRWSVGTLLKGRIDDKIYVDMGQGWYVTGMKKVLDEVRNNVRQEYVIASERGFDKANIAKEILAAAKLLVAAELPLGYFLVTKDFRIGFGAWRMSFRKGSVLRSARGHLYGFDPKRGDWVERHPPISGRSSFSLSSYGREYEQAEQLKNFTSGTKEISEREATRLTIDSEQRMTVQVKEIEKVVTQLGLRPRDEVVLIIPPQR